MKKMCNSTILLALWAGFLLAIPAAGVLAGGTGEKTAAPAQKVVISLATETSPPDGVAVLAAKFKELAEQKAGDLVEIRLHLGGTLGDQRQLQQQVQLGSTEAIGTGSDMTELEPKLSFFDFPFLFDSRQAVYRVLDGPIGQELNKNVIQDKGVRILAYGELGFRQITNRVRPIVTPVEMKGLKIRVPPVKIRVAAFNAMGAAATPIPYKELYTSLQQGVVDGQENPLVTIEALSLWEVQKYVTLSNHVYTPAYLLINEKFWQSLPPDLRKQLQEAATEAAAWQRKGNQMADEQILTTAKSKGMQVNQPDTRSLTEAARPVWNEFIERVGQDLLNRILATKE